MQFTVNDRIKCTREFPFRHGVKGLAGKIVRVCDQSIAALREDFDGTISFEKLLLVEWDDKVTSFAFIDCVEKELV